MSVRRVDAGFTLIELLIASVLLSVVFGVVSAGFVVGIRATDEGANRLVESNDGAVTSAYFNRDVHGAQAVTVTGTSVCSAVGISVLTLTMQEPLTSGAVSRTVEYRYGPIPGTLVRHQCGSESSVLTLSTRLKAAPSAACSSGCRMVTLALRGITDGAFDLAAYRRTR